MATPITIRYTIAPASYDGCGTQTLAVVGPYDKKPLRHVAIETPHLDWQEYRYGSGMHRSFTPEEFAEDAVDALVYPSRRSPQCLKPYSNNPTSFATSVAGGRCCHACQAAREGTP